MIPINPGIAKTVEWLNDNGFETCDSGDGATHACECDRPYPFVVIVVDPYRENLIGMADEVLALLRTKVTIGPLGPETPEGARHLERTSEGPYLADCSKRDCEDPAHRGGDVLASARHLDAKLEKN